MVAELSRAELVRVADSDTPESAPPQLASVEVDSSDEIGELAAAVNRVQATAALLLERQVSTRANVATMFANIARRTQNLVGRQLQLIDELERNERDPELLKRLYQLDHVATRLRRSADSLLVVSGTIDQTLSVTPTRLSDVIRSALAEIEGYRAVELGQIADVAVAADLVGDLRLLLAELLENATNFSPPGSPVAVTAVLRSRLHDRDRRPRPGHEPGPPGRGEPAPASSASGWTWRRRACSACSWSAGWPAGTAWPCGSSCRRGAASPRRCASRPACSARPKASPGQPMPTGPTAPGASVRCRSRRSRSRRSRVAARSGPFPWLGAESNLVAIAGAPAAPRVRRRQPASAPPSVVASEIPVRTSASRSDHAAIPSRTCPRSCPAPRRASHPMAAIDAARRPTATHGGLSRRIPGTTCRGRSGRRGCANGTTHSTRPRGRARRAQRVSVRVCPWRGRSGSGA